MGKEEADPTLELAMEYAGALGTIIFDKSCRLHDLTEAQVGRSQFTMDIAVDQLDDKIDEVDRRADQVLEQLLALEGQVTDMAERYRELLALGQEQTATSVQACRAIIVRELPPPTPREAYLPQRPGRTHKREASELRLT